MNPIINCASLITQIFFPTLPQPIFSPLFYSLLPLLILPNNPFLISGFVLNTCPNSNPFHHLFFMTLNLSPNLILKLTPQTATYFHHSFYSPHFSHFMKSSSTFVPMTLIAFDLFHWGTYRCEWKECCFDIFPDFQGFIRHVYFHTFHTKIKSIGSIIIKKDKLNPCMLDSSSRNMIPDLPERFHCGWEGCKVDWSICTIFNWFDGFFVLF